MIRQFNHPHRAMAPYRHKQRKQHLFQLDAGCLQDLLSSRSGWFITLMISSSAP